MAAELPSTGAKERHRHRLERNLWFALDMDEGVLAVAPTRSEVMRLAEVPKSSDRGWRRERVRYGPTSEEIVFALCGEDEAESVFIEHGTGTATSGGWQDALERWRELGSPVGVRMDELEVG